MTCAKKTYFNSALLGNDAIMRQRLRDLMSNMETNVDEIEGIISNFESRLDSITRRLDNLEDRVSRLEKKTSLLG